MSISESKLDDDANPQSPEGSMGADSHASHFDDTQDSPTKNMTCAQGLPEVRPEDRTLLLTQLLKGVSRAFYLTLRVLPASLREPIGLAYLLARAADTIADTEAIPAQDRLRYLLSFREQIQGPAQFEPLSAIDQALTSKQAIPDERTLLQALPLAFALLEQLDENDRKHVRHVVTTLTQGMEIDLTYFPPEQSDGKIKAFQEASELDRYIYYVAGCVGAFWTELTVAHSPALKGWDVKPMSEKGIRFGKALQLTNVLRDLPKDLRIGRCYLPGAELKTHNLKADDLLQTDALKSVRPVLIHWIETALSHFEAAEEYVLAIPRRCIRLRLAVLWPILIGLGTFEKVVNNPDWLDPDQRSKVSRGWVYRMMILSIPASFSNTLLHWWMKRLRKRVVSSF